MNEQPSLEFFVFEIQDDGTGHPASLKNEIHDIGVAYQTFYTILAAASVSGVLRHGAVIVSSDLSICETKLAYRAPVNPEPSAQ